ncbi:DoxX family membrane protein [Halovenus sp. WSH3]|uniref:DoxX family membrane protein n=1 Tax=Halovenus carboxidivorans TaxID=2692199 RepID=A0A6B0T7X2_9EURY|nr:DoxX family protein [Halovenus carboxidivorans]MXR51402.1 DoxX family membrane protein [Halovenus carboxidivorans]
MGHVRRIAGAAAAGGAVVAGLAEPAAAHVDYVTDEDAAGSARELFAAVFSDPVSVAVLLFGSLAVLGLAVGYLRFAGSLRDITVARRTLQSYQPYLPWMLRLSVGLPLVGAGFAGYLFTPVVGADARLLQVGIGFLLLFGLGTRIVAALGLVTYLGALFTVGTPMLLASEYIAGFLAILVVGPGQPSADLMLRRLVVTDGTLLSRFRGIRTVGGLLTDAGIERGAAPVLLRLFLGLNFLYLGIAQKWLEPASALAVVEKYNLVAVVPVSPELWVFGAGLVEAAVGVAFVTGTFTRGAAATGFVLLTTTLFGLPDDPVLAHITLFGLSSALLITGSGRFSLDSTILPALGHRLDPEQQPAAD